MSYYHKIKNSLSKYYYNYVLLTSIEILKLSQKFQYKN